MAEPGPAVAGADLAAAAAAAVETAAAAAARSAPAIDMLEQLKKEKAELRKRSAEVVKTLKKAEPPGSSLPPELPFTQRRAVLKLV